MLNVRLIADDLRELCRLVDEQSVQTGAEVPDPNVVIYESLAYIHNTLLPTLI